MCVLLHSRGLCCQERCMHWKGGGKTRVCTAEAPFSADFGRLSSLLGGKKKQEPNDKSRLHPGDEKSVFPRKLQHLRASLPSSCHLQVTDRGGGGQWEVEHGCIRECSPRSCIIPKDQIVTGFPDTIPDTITMDSGNERKPTTAVLPPKFLFSA